MIWRNIFKRIDRLTNSNISLNKAEITNLEDGSELFSEKSIRLQLTSRVKIVDFGTLTRITDEGTETVWVLKITDEFDSEFRFMLGTPEDYNGEVLDEAGELFLGWLELLGYEDD